MEALFRIAMADGVYDDREEKFLEKVSEILEQDRSELLALQARHVPDAWDPRKALGLPPDANDDEARAARGRIARETHPDALRARGLSDEMVRLAEQRLRVANRALEEIRSESAPSPGK